MAQADDTKQKKKAMTNAEKQKAYRERKKAQGLSEIRAYMSPEAQECYKALAEKTGWSDSKLVSNAIRLALAAYKCKQIPTLNSWLEKNDM